MIQDTSVDSRYLFRSTMKKKNPSIDITELRKLVSELLEEEISQGSGGPPPLPPGASGRTPLPASAALPAPGALNKFKADINMAADAAQKVQAAVASANTPEALRWLDKVIHFATSAKAQLPKV